MPGLQIKPLTTDDSSLPGTSVAAPRHCDLNHICVIFLPIDEYYLNAK